MSTIAELRVVLPINYEDFARGRRYALAKSVLEDSEKAKRPAQLVEQTDSTKTMRYDIAQMMPAISILKPFLGAENMYLEEETLFDRKGSYKYREFTCPMISSFKSCVHSVTVKNDIGELDNVFEIAEDFKKFDGTKNAPKPNTVMHFDFATHKLEEKHYSASEDPLLINQYGSENPLNKNWLEQHKKAFKANPDKIETICEYKIAEISISVPFSGSVKNKILNNAVIAQMILCYRRVFAWRNEWQNMTDAELDQYIADCDLKIKNNEIWNQNKNKYA